MFDLLPQRVPPLQQSEAFEHALRRYGADVGRELGYLTLRRRILGCRVMMIPRFACPAPAALLDHLPRGPVLLSPEQPSADLARSGALRVARPSAVAALTLQDHDAMLRGMHQKCRNRLRHAQRQDLRIRIGRYPAPGDHWLLDADARQARVRGYQGWPPALTRAWAAEAQDQTLLVEAFDARGPVAAMLFLLHGNSATYHIGHSTPEGRAVSAHNLLLWSAMQRLSRKGYETLDLGLLTSPSLDRFKLGTGAVRHLLGGTWLWVRPARPIIAGVARLIR